MEDALIARYMRDVNKMEHVVEINADIAKRYWSQANASNVKLMRLCLDNIKNNVFDPYVVQIREFTKMEFA